MCDVKWALGSIIMNEASGDDKIPIELFKILKDDAVQVLAVNIPVTSFKTPVGGPPTIHQDP